MVAIMITTIFCTSPKKRSRQFVCETEGHQQAGTLVSTVEAVVRSVQQSRSLQIGSRKWPVGDAARLQWPLPTESDRADYEPLVDIYLFKATPESIASEFYLRSSSAAAGMQRVMRQFEETGQLQEEEIAVLQGRIDEGRQEVADLRAENLQLQRAVLGASAALALIAGLGIAGLVIWGVRRAATA